MNGIKGQNHYLSFILAVGEEKSLQSNVIAIKDIFAITMKTEIIQLKNVLYDSFLEHIQFNHHLLLRHMSLVTHHKLIPNKQLTGPQELMCSQ